MADGDEKKGVTVVIRFIRSFGHRNIRNGIFRNVDTSQLVSEFIEFVSANIKTRTDLPPPFRTFSYDTMKVQHQAFGAKTSDPVINTLHDEELMLKPDSTLAESGVTEETEISFFKLEDYKVYQANPQLVW